MEFGTNFTWSEVFRKDFTPKFAMSHIKFCQYYFCSPKKCIFFPPRLPQFLPINMLYLCSTQPYFILPEELTKQG